MKMKKIVSTLLVMLIIISMLNGCRESEKTTESESKTATEDTNDTTNDTKHTTDDNGYTTDEKGNKFYTDENGIKFYVDEDGTMYKTFDDKKIDYLVCWTGSDSGRTEDEQYNNDVAAAIREKIGVTVISESIMMKEIEKLNMMFASGEVPTMTNAAWWGGSSGETVAIQKAINDGLILNVADLIPQYTNISNCWDIGVISQAFLMAEVDKPENNGGRFIVPSQMAATPTEFDNTPYGVYVRADVAKTFGIDPTMVKTKEQLMDFMEKADKYGFKDVNGNDTITVGTLKNGWKYFDYLQNFMPKKLSEFLMNENGKITYDRLSQNFIDMHMYIWKMVNSGMMDVECFKQSTEQADQKVGNGTYLFSCAIYNANINPQKDSGLWDTYPEMRYVPIGPLNWADGSPGSNLQQEGVYGCPVFFFSADADQEDIEAALTWLNYVNGKEGSRLLQYGFEGDTYELNEKGQPRVTEKLQEQYISDKEAYDDYMEQRGINCMRYRSFITSNNMKWFGELKPMYELNWDEEDDYALTRPVEVLPGMSIAAIASQYPGYSDLYANALDDNRLMEYTQRAYFADTEEEAIKILKSYQNFISSYNNGDLSKLLDYLSEAVKQFDNVAY